MFNLFLTDQHHVHDLVTLYAVFPEACLSLNEFLLIVAQCYLMYNAKHYIAGMGDKCNSYTVLAVHVVPFLVDRHIDGYDPSAVLLLICLIAFVTSAGRAAGTGSTTLDPHLVLQAVQPGLLIVRIH